MPKPRPRLPFFRSHDFTSTELPASARHRNASRLPRLRLQPLFILFVLCVAAAILSPAQSLTTLHSFAGPDGQWSAAPLILARDGNYYGTTSAGGSTGGGTVFKMRPSGTLTTLYTFCSQPQCTDGSAPMASLVQATDGNYYGTTSAGGSTGGGTAFKITPSGTLTTLHSFCSQPNCVDGNGPLSPVQGNDGDIYGTTFSGGTGGFGTFFKITLGGVFSVVYSFDAAHGESPNGPIQATDGNFYLTAYQGGTNNAGTVVRITPSGTATVLYNFCSQFGCTDGNLPDAALLQSTDGNFYGTTLRGGTFTWGTVFKITPSGTLTTLHSFDLNDGAELTAAVIQGVGGNFYGTTYAGGVNNMGAIFGMTPGGSLTLLHSFAGSDGARPQGGLVQASDGSLYGTALYGGSSNCANGCGTVFQLSGLPVSTTTVLATAPNPSNLGQAVTMTATVTAQNHSIPTGTVVFNSNGGQIGSASLNNSGVATLVYSGLPLGTDSLQAVYQGSPPFTGSTSNTVLQMVGTTMTAVTSTPNPSTVGQVVTITATVNPDVPGGPPLTGTVSFTSNSTAIPGCTDVPLNSLQAVCTTSTLALGTDVIVATYSGDSNYLPSNGTLIQIVNPVPTPVQFVPVTPCRMVDTRNPNGPFGGPPIGGHSSRNFPLAQNGNPCNLPASAVAYSLNVTAIPSGHLGYLTIWPTGEGQPIVSTLNSPDGRVKANAAIIPTGTPAGSVTVYVTDMSNVLLDINGYFEAPGAGTYQFYPLTPCRIVDTRKGNDQGTLQAGVERDYVIAGNCGVPTTATAYSFNVTVSPTQGSLDYLTVWPQGEARPGVSTLNDKTGTVVANAAIVPAGSNNTTAFYAHNHNTDLLLDINGYFAPPEQGGLSLYPVTPCRVLDTRQGSGAFQHELTVDVLHSFCAPPITAQAYVFNATVVPKGLLGYLTLWPDSEQQPNVSTLNAQDGAITSNMAIVPTSNGKIDAYASALTQLLLDINGYFAP